MPQKILPRSPRPDHLQRRLQLKHFRQAHQRLFCRLNVLTESLDSKFHILEASCIPRQDNTFQSGLTAAGLLGSDTKFAVHRQLSGSG